MRSTPGEPSALTPLDPVDLSRRKVVKVALAASAVAVPVISSVALGGVSPAFAESPNISGQTTTAGTTTTGSTTSGTTATPSDVTTTASPTEGTTTVAPTEVTTTASPTETTPSPTPTIRPTRPTLPPNPDPTEPT